MLKSVLLICGIVIASCVAACDNENRAASGNSTTSAPTTIKVVFSDVDKLADAMASRVGAKRSAHVTMDMAVAGQSNVTATGTYRQDSPSATMQLTMKFPSGETEMISSGDTIYLKLPNGQEFQPGKRWVKISAQGADQVSQSYGPTVTAIRDDLNIVQASEDMKVAGKISKSTHEQINGIDTIRYSITLDVAKLAEAEQDPTKRAELRQAVQGGLKEIVTELWVDQETLPVKANGGLILPSGSFQLISAATYSKWGTPVDIKAPPADQVAEVSSR